MNQATNINCSRCGAASGKTIKRLRDKIYSEISDHDFDQFVEYIRRNKTTGEKSRAIFKYELVALTTVGEQYFCTNCMPHHKADLLRNRKNVPADNTGNGILF